MFSPTPAVNERTVSGVWTEEAEEEEEGGGVCVLINVALAVGVRRAVRPLLYVGHVFVKVRQRHRVLLVDLPLHVRLQHRPLIVGKRHGEQGLGVAHKLVDVSLAGHLDGDGGGDGDGDGDGDGKINEVWFLTLRTPQTDLGLSR